MVWWVLTAIAVIAFFAYWHRPNAVGGCATVGLLIGILMVLFVPGHGSWIVGKAVVIGCLIGLVFELLPRLAKLRR